uniref:Uncharacterized protein n=1 Tax=Erythrolobus australicus TaxID=1077150 RepID=A0A7S1XGW7_9RHOD
MPVFELRVRCEVENVAAIVADDAFAWRIRVRCNHCGEESPHPLVLYSTDKVELIRGGAASALYKCKLCERQNDVTLLKDGEHVISTDTGDDDDTSPTERNTQSAYGWHTFARFECRGMQPVAWEFDDDLVIVTGSGFRIEGAAFEDGAFYGYDEKAMKECSVTELESDFCKA